MTLKTKGDLIGAAHAWAARKGLGQLSKDLSVLFKFIDKKFGTRIEKAMGKLRLETSDIHYLQNITDILKNDTTSENLGAST